MRYAGDCYRAHHPRWAYSPLSGEGACSHGGRFNPKGLPTLYLALSIDGAVAEAAQGFAFKLEPLTICLYEVNCEDIADLRSQAGRQEHGVNLADLACPWFLDVAENRVPASWRLAETLIARGQAGMLVPSFAHGAKPDAANLVLWRWSSDLPHRVSVHDPSGRLSIDQMSWQGA